MTTQTERFHTRIIQYHNLDLEERLRLAAYLRVILAILEPTYKANVRSLAHQNGISAPTVYYYAEKILAVAVGAIRGVSVGRPRKRKADYDES